MSAYFVTIPLGLTPEQREAVADRGWEVSADLRNDVMAAAVPTTVIDISCDSPEQAAGVVAEFFGLDPGELRVEER